MAVSRVRSTLVQYVFVATAVVLIPCCVVPAYAQRVVATKSDPMLETQRISIDVENISLLSAIHFIARQAGVLPVFDETIIPSVKRVTLHLRNVTASEAFQQALRGTGLVARLHTEGDVAIVRAAGVFATAGVVIGRVIDANTKQPLRGARIGIDGVDRGVETGPDGTYKFVGLSPGAHTLTAKLIGYTKVSRSINVQDNSTTMADFALGSSATPLDQVVVTGTAVVTELRAVPNAITVITFRQIEERGITKIDQLFRGDIPGLFAQNVGSGALLDEVTMFSRGATALTSLSAGVSFFGTTNPIKTYVDGVELANPKYLSQIDPKSIERIEILTGPQASTIYGSNAINGVMQVFTKRGAASYPELVLDFMSGLVENNFSSARTPRHDYSAQLSGVEGHLSYNAGGSWNYMGAWTPAKQTARTGGFGGTRLDLPTPAGRVTADATLRRGITQNQQRGDVLQTLTGFRESGWYSVVNSSGVSRPATYVLTGQTLGLTLGFTPTSWWSHELGFGTDVSDAETRITARGYRTVSDTILSFQQLHAARRSLRYTTTSRVPITSVAQATIIAGADAWQNVATSLSVSPQTLTGALTGFTAISRQPSHNTGGFLQTQVGVKDRLFLTYGLRLEWNPDFGEHVRPDYAPRYGAAYTEEMGPVTAKLRASYGRSTRPPQHRLKVAVSGAEVFGADVYQYYGSFDEVLANPALGPEHQQGGEGGLELYLGDRASLIVTRYNQTVDGLIANVTLADSIDLLPEWKATFGVGDWDPNYVIYQSQYLNVGSIRNQGWELQGSANVGPFTTRGTYSWTKSRTIGITSKYQALFNASDYPQYQSGATFRYLPEHTWAVGISYAHSQSTVGLNVTGIGRAGNTGDELSIRRLSNSVRLPQNQLNVSNTGAHINSNSGYALVDLMGSSRVSARVEGLLQIQNLMNRYTNDFYAAYPSLGRQSKAGVRIRFR